MKIIVGSKSVHKINAVKEACEGLRIVAEVIGVPAKSGINEQPYGLDETVRGAEARAGNACLADSSADLWIGIESGLVHGVYHFDVTAIVVLTKTGERYHALAGGHRVDHEYVGLAMQCGFYKRTAGDEMATASGCDSTDGTAYMTGHRVTRTDMITQAAKVALSTWLATIEARAEMSQ